MTAIGWRTVSPGGYPPPALFVIVGWGGLMVKRIETVRGTGRPGYGRASLIPTKRPDAGVAEVAYIVDRMAAWDTRPPAPETIVMPSWPPGSAPHRRPPSLAEKPSMH